MAWQWGKGEMSYTPSFAEDNPVLKISPATQKMIFTNRKLEKEKMISTTVEI